MACMAARGKVDANWFSSTRRSLDPKSDPDSVEMMKEGGLELWRDSDW